MAQRARTKKGNPTRLRTSSPVEAETLLELRDQTLGMSTMRWDEETDPEVEAGDTPAPGGELADVLRQLLQGGLGEGQYQPQYITNEGPSFYASLPAPWNECPHHRKPQEYEMRVLDLTGGLQPLQW